MKVNFYLKDSKKTRSAVFAVVSYKNNQYKLATGISVPVELWDKNNKYLKKTIENKDFETYEIQFNRISSKITEAFTEYMLDRSIPTIEQIRAKLSNNKSQIKDKRYFLDYFTEYYKNAPYKLNTYKKYHTARGWLVAYEKTHRKLTFENLDLAFYDNFRHFVLNGKYFDAAAEIERNYSKNYFGSIIKCIKVVLKETGPESRLKLHQNISYKLFKTESETADTIYLDLNELDKISSLDFSELEKQKAVALTIARNKFLIGCFTALRVSDFNRLQEINIQSGLIRIRPLKGSRKNEDVVIPIHPTVRKILDSGFDISTPMSDQKLNKHLKDLCQLAEINEKIVTSRTEGGKVIDRVHEKWQLVTTHTARRSGATNMFIAGIPSISIMKITGHKTESNFLKYIKISQEENARLLAEHPFFKGGKLTDKSNQ